MDEAVVACSRPARLPVQRLSSCTTVLVTLDGNQIQVPNSTVSKSTIPTFTAIPNGKPACLFLARWRSTQLGESRVSSRIPVCVVGSGGPVESSAPALVKPAAEPEKVATRAETDRQSAALGIKEQARRSSTPREGLLIASSSSDSSRTLRIWQIRVQRSSENG